MLLRQESLLRELKGRDLQKSIVLPWRREQKNGDLSKKESELRLNRGLKLNVSREKRDSKSTKLSKKEEKLRDKQELKLKELNTKKESRWRDLNVRRDSKNTDWNKIVLELKEKLKLKP